ncbi:MAG: glycosyltransferase family 2 protein [Lachnospiraceae bacterium]|nr:glycosyltransferase family 2 protein [Lachnospiraceae bacterium]
MRFSVVFPAYNVASYIREAILCVTESGYEDLEVIVVNDGSTDSTSKVVNETIKGKENVRFIDRQENKGVSETRNEGLKNAKGDYVLFLDSDDCIEKNLFKKLDEKIREAEMMGVLPDMVVFGLYEDYYENDEKKYEKIHSCPGGLFLANGGEYKENDVLYKAVELEKETLLGYPWNKAYKRLFLEKNGFRFKKITHIEDILFNVDAVKRAFSLLVIDEPLYHYRNEGQKRLTSKRLDNYFNLQKKRVSAVLSISEDAKDIAASEYYRSFMSMIEREIAAGQSREEIISMSEKEAGDELYKGFSDYVPPGRKLKILYAPIMEGNFKKAYFYAKVIHTIKEKAPMVFAAAKQER